MDSPDTLELCFAVSRPGKYRIIGMVQGVDGRADSFFVRVADRSEVLWETGRSDSFVPGSVRNRGESGPVLIDLAAGEHVVTFGLREDGTRLDSVELILVEATAPELDDLLTQGLAKAIVSSYAADEAGRIDVSHTAHADDVDGDGRLSDGDVVSVKRADGSTVTSRTLSVNDVYRLRMSEANAEIAWATTGTSSPAWVWYSSREPS